MLEVNEEDKSIICPIWTFYRILNRYGDSKNVPATATLFDLEQDLRTDYDVKLVISPDPVSLSDGIYITLYFMSTELFAEFILLYVR